MSSRARFPSPVLTVEDRTGDGSFFDILPSPLRGVLRSVTKRLGDQRRIRVMRVARRLYPILQKLEKRALPKDDQKLQNLSLAEVLQSDETIERALRMFVSAWDSNIVRLNDVKGKAIPPNKTQTVCTACGMTIEKAQIFFIDMALNKIFRKKPAAKRRLMGNISNPKTLTNLRILSQSSPLTLTELVTGMGYQVNDILANVKPTTLHALAALKVYHLRALRHVLGSGFCNVFAWPPEMIQALGEQFSCAEQIHDLGNAIALVGSAEAMAALGRWDVRDITEKVNSERAARGLPDVEGQRFETDIAVGRVIFGSYFNTLMENPAEILQALGTLIGRIRQTDKVNRKDRVDEFRLFCDRFLEYVGTDVMRALGMVGPNPTSIGEALHILEGLFTKPGLGRRFFEGPLQTSEGIKAIASLREDLDEIKRRGSIKDVSDISRLIAQSDMLDRAIIPFINFKQ